MVGESGEIVSDLMTKIKCAKCYKEKDPMLIRPCPMVKKDVCLDCCMRCMFYAQGKCGFKAAAK